MYLSTPTTNYRIEIFAGYVTPHVSYIYTTSFPDDEAYNEYLAKMISQSNFTADVEVDADDKIITLTIYIYDFEDARYVIQGKLVKIY